MFFENRDAGYRILDVTMRYRPTVIDRTMENPNHAELLYFIRADATVFRTETEEYSLHHGSLIYLPTGVTYRHIAETEKTVRVQLRVFGTDGTALDCFDAAQTRKFDPIFRKIAAEWENRFSGYENRCLSLLYGIFEQMTRLCEEDRHGKQGMLIEPGVRYLRENLASSELTVASAAELCHISEVYFREIYRLVYGTSPLKDITEARIRRACEFLSEGKYRVGEVADLCGFSDAKYFSRVFRSVMKITPRAYMKRFA